MKSEISANVFSRNFFLHLKKIRLKIVWNVYPNLFWILTTKKIGKKIHDQKNWKKNSNIKNNFFITYFFVLKSSETYARKNLVIGPFWGWGSADRYLRITLTFSYKFKLFWMKKKCLEKKKLLKNIWIFKKKMLIFWTFQSLSRNRLV